VLYVTTSALCQPTDVPAIPKWAGILTRLVAPYSGAYYNKEVRRRFFDSSTLAIALLHWGVPTVPACCIPLKSVKSEIEAMVSAEASSSLEVAANRLRPDPVGPTGATRWVQHRFK